MAALQIVGRRSSHFTRLTLLFAEELAVPYELVPVYDMASTAPESFGGNAALKIPVLLDGGSRLVGSENICRALAERASAPKRIVWPEALTDDLSRNAQELVWHGMASQVQLILGISLYKLPADNPYFVKARRGFEGALHWLDGNLAGVRARLPPCDMSLLEASLHCPIEHMQFRPTLPVAPFENLVAFASEFGQRQAAQATQFRFDQPPS